MGLQDVFKENLKKYRKKAGFTQENLAELCNTAPCYIRQIELGRRFPSVAYIERIASALNISPYLLFYVESTPEKLEREILNTAQKAKVKAMLLDNVNKICLMIDEQC
jgi:transcriptional regulator with XRE-family HTH domain